MLREQLWFDFCDDLPIEIEQRIDEGILEAERFKERAEQVKEMPRGAARTAAGAQLSADGRRGRFGTLRLLGCLFGGHRQGKSRADGARGSGFRQP